MSVTRETVLHTSRLARLNIGAGLEGAEAEEKIKAFAAKMDTLVQYMDILNQADTSGVEPLFSPVKLTAPPRPDTVKQDYKREDILQNAPEQENGCFVVPRVI